MQALLSACLAIAAPPTPTRLHWIDDASLLRAGFSPWTELPLWLPEDDPDHGGMLLAQAARAHASCLVSRPIEDTVRDTLEWLQASGSTRLTTVSTATTNVTTTSVTTLDAAKEAHWLETWTRRR